MRNIYRTLAISHGKRYGWSMNSPFSKTLLLLGAGELGKEFTISAKRLGQKVIAVDRYEGAPAMQVADGFEVIDMLDASALEKVISKHKPDIIIPEIEAIRTEKLKEFEHSRPPVSFMPKAKRNSQRRAKKSGSRTWSNRSCLHRAKANRWCEKNPRWSPRGRLLAKACAAI